VTAGNNHSSFAETRDCIGKHSSWLEEGREQDVGDPAESTDPQSGKTE